jgi:hypothetical protein
VIAQAENELYIKIGESEIRRMREVRQAAAESYRKAIGDATEILRKNRDEKHIDFDNSLPDIIKLIESLPKP